MLLKPPYLVLIILANDNYNLKKCHTKGLEDNPGPALRPSPQVSLFAP